MTEISSIAVHIGLLHGSGQLLCCHGISDLSLAGNIVGQLTRRATVAVRVITLRWRSIKGRELFSTLVLYLCSVHTW